jgi:hypothetical protein
VADDIQVTPPVPWKGAGGTYEVVLRFASVEGRMECVGVDVEPVPRGTRVLTAVALRSIPLGKLVEKRRPKPGDVNVSVEPGGIVWKGGEVNATVTPSTVAAVAAVGAPTVSGTAAARRGGRPPKYGPEHWQKVADVYRTAFAGKRLTPTRAVARRFKVSQSAAAKWVAKCRDLGLLPPTTRGKPRMTLKATGRIRLWSRAKATAVPPAKRKR